MKILHVVATCDPRGGGPVEGIWRLGEAFARLGHSSELLTLDHVADRWVAEAPRKVHAVGAAPRARAGPLNRVRNWLRRTPAAPAWLREHLCDYDGVIVDGLWNYSTRTARLALPGRNVPYVVFSHGMLDPWFRERYPLKHAVKQLLWLVNEGPLLRGAEAVAFTCERERELARTTFRPWGMREAVVGFGTSAPPARTPAMEAAFRDAVPELADKPYFLFLSRLHEKKGIEQLLEGFAASVATSGIDLVIAGPGDRAYRAELEALAHRICPFGRVHWPGMLQGDAKWGALYGCEAMTLISHQENFGVVVAEALACRRPVVISDQVNIAPEVEKAGAGIVCADRPDAAAAALLRFAAMEESERSAMGTRGLELFDEKFRMDGVAERLVELLFASKSPETN